MSTVVSCPRCGGYVERGVGCRHLRWTPDRGGPVEFARYVVQMNPYTKGRGFGAADIPATWLELQQEWLLERIMTRLDVIDGYCFGDVVDLDRLCMDIWNELVPQKERRLSADQAAELTPDLTP